MLATEAARRIAARTLSPVTLMDAVLARAAQLDPVLRLFAQPMFQAARHAAKQAEVAVRDGVVGPLHGVPITIKDNIAVAGVPMRSGSDATLAVVPLADGLTVRRARAAGAIVIGKTTLPEFAHKVLTDNAIDGATRNPWDLSRTPGGSSGGASAALAAGVAPLAIGTDGGGSIRCPASCTSTVGLKATLGRVPNETAPAGLGRFFFVGPMARTVGDVRSLLSVIEGPDAAGPYACQAGRRSTRFGPLRVGPLQLGPLRVGVVEQFGYYGRRLHAAGRGGDGRNSACAGSSTGAPRVKIAALETLQADAGWRSFSFLKVTTACGIVGWSEFNESPGVLRNRVVAEWVIGL